MPWATLRTIAPSTTLGGSRLRTTMCYDRARKNLDGHPAYMASGRSRPNCSSELSARLGFPTRWPRKTPNPPPRASLMGFGKSLR
jgi:hypothetical protein